MSDRLDVVNSRLNNELDRVAIQSGGLNLDVADTMI